MKRPVIVLLLVGAAGAILLCAGGLLVGVLTLGRYHLAGQRQIDDERIKAYEEAVTEISVPIVRSAQSREPRSADRLYLNLTNEGHLIVLGRGNRITTLSSQQEWQYYLEEQRETAGATAPAVILRADRSTDYSYVHKLRRVCKDCGLIEFGVLVTNANGGQDWLKIDDVVADWRRPESSPDLIVKVMSIRDGINDGDISALIVQKRTGEVTMPNLDALQRYLRDALGERAINDLIRIIPDSNLKHAAVAEVVDACLEAGFQQVALAAPPELEAGDAGSNGDDPASKAPVPEVAVLNKIDQELKTIYRKDYARSEPADQTALAGKLRQAGDECHSEPAARFVLWREAARLAASAGDVATALQTLNDRMTRYQVNAWDMKLQLLKTAQPRASQAVADGALLMASGAYFSGETDRADHFLTFAAQAAQESKNADLQERVEARRQEMARLKALRSNAIYRELVRQEEVRPASAQAQVDRADGWWKLAGKAQDPEKRELLLAAHRWYAQATQPKHPAGKLEEAVRARAEDRLKETAQIGGQFPGGWAGRTGDMRENLVREGGGNTRSEAAVAAGLRWLIRHQALDGHWGLNDFHVHGKCNCSGQGSQHDVAGTAFALLPLLGAGVTHKAVNNDKLYARNVERGLQWLLSRQSTDGSLSANGYEQALATIVLCEAYGLTADPALRHPAQKAIDACVAWQHADGGFRYTPRIPGDMSVSAWFIQALKAGSKAGLNVPNATFNGINNFLDMCANAEGSGYTYQKNPGNQAAPVVTAAGLLSRQYMGWGPRDVGLQKGLEYLRKLPPSPNFRSLYHYYYATPVVYHMASFVPEAWEQWNPRMRDLLIDTQDQGINPDRRDQKGSWSPEGDHWGGQLGRLGCTSLALLTLEVYYRHLPLTQDK